jgi:hypothetical protein
MGGSGRSAGGWKADIRARLKHGTKNESDGHDPPSREVGPKLRRLVVAIDKRPSPVPDAAGKHRERYAARHHHSYDGVSAVLVVHDQSVALGWPDTKRCPLVA